MKVKLAEASWVELEGVKHGPGDVIEVSSEVGAALIAGQSATPVDEPAPKPGRRGAAPAKEE